MEEMGRKPGVEPPMAQIPLDALDPNPYQPRATFNEVSLRELVSSVREHGILQPVIVRPMGLRYQLVSGERRYHAARRAGLGAIPAMIRSYSDREVAEIALVENVQREDITPLEAAEAYRRLMEEFGVTQEQVAQRVGKSRPAIANTLRLLSLPDPIKESLARGDITEGHARSLLSIRDPEWQRRVWQRIVGESLSVRDTEHLARGGEGTPREKRERQVSDVSRETGPRRDPPDPHLIAVEDRLRLVLGTRVRIRGAADEGAIVIDYYSADDLDRLLSLLDAG